MLSVFTNLFVKQNINVVFERNGQLRFGENFIVAVQLHDNVIQLVPEDVYGDNEIKVNIFACVTGFEVKLVSQV